MRDERHEALKRSLQSEFEQSIDARIERYRSVDHQRFIGNHHFAHASHECLLLYRDGYFTACIMMTQAVADGILTFVSERNGVHQADRETKQSLASRMQQSDILNYEFVEAFCRIQRSFRNDLHHMNPPVAKIALEPIARKNIESLASIEREIFGIDTGPEGLLIPRQPKYWDSQPDGRIPVYVRGL
jgi:hypothetical protein